MSKAGKYLKKKRRSYGFAIGVIVYAVLFLALTGVGLNYLWDFMDAYEVSRPENTITAYMTQLTPEHVADGSEAVISQIDSNIQDEASCRQAILDFLGGGISFARKSSECTDEKNVYVLRSGGKVIGSVELVPQGEERYGFTPWAVTHDEFDLSFLIGTSASITVPHNYCVYVGDTLLDESYLTTIGIKYEELDEFYGEYDLPYQVTYTAGPILGVTEFHVTDPAGNPVTIDENTDLNAFLNNCTPEVSQELDAFSRDFITRYAAYLSSTKNTRWGNYNSLKELVVSNSDLSKRLSNALEGLEFGQSKSDVISAIVVNYIVDIGNDRYICDITYEVDSEGTEGIYHSVNNAKVVIVRTEYGLKAEKLLSY